jgi:FtsZ-interacting cell division protein ZipA
MTVVLIVVGVMCLAGFVALFMWVRRSERDVDYDDLMKDSTQTDEERRVKQLGIGLTSGPTIWGPQ